jgi:hypothetical protein
LTTITAVSNLQDDNLSLNIVPNPSLELPFLEITQKEKGRPMIEILDVMGRKVIFRKQLDLTEGENRISMADYMDKPKSGSYWVRLITGNRVMVRQWIVLP